MSVTVYFANISKKRNSTYQGTFTQSFDCTLKMPTSLDRPTFLISAASFDYNAAKMDNRYYFVTDIVSVRNGQWEVSCELDVLATFKSYITASSQLVSRCVTNPDYTLIDEVPNVQMTPTVVYPKISSALPLTLSNASVVITTKGESGSVFYAMTMARFQFLAQQFYAMDQNDDIWATLAVPATWFKSYLDPFSYITDAKIIPIAYDDIAGTITNEVVLGYWNYTNPVPGDEGKIFKEITDRILYVTTDPITIQLEALQTGADTFLNSNKFRNVEVILPGAETLTLDADMLTQGNELNIDASIDITGAIAYRVSYGGSHIVYTFGSVGIPIAMHSNIPNVNGAIGGIGNVLKGAGAGLIAGSALSPIGALGGALVGAVSQLPSAIQNAGPLGISTTKGSDGSLAGIAINTKIQVNETRYTISGRGPVTNGYPCMKYLQLSTLSGYCQCINARVAAPAQAPELEQIDNFLNTGFYIE